MGEEERSNVPARASGGGGRSGKEEGGRRKEKMYDGGGFCGKTGTVHYMCRTGYRSDLSPFLHPPLLHFSPPPSLPFPTTQRCHPAAIENDIAIPLASTPSSFLPCILPPNHRPFSCISADWPRKKWTTHSLYSRCACQIDALHPSTCLLPCRKTTALRLTLLSSPQSSPISICLTRAPSQRRAKLSMRSRLRP